MEEIKLIYLLQHPWLCRRPSNLTEEVTWLQYDGTISNFHV